VDSMVRDLVQVAIRMVEKQKTDAVKGRADERAVGRVVDVLQPRREAPPRRARASKAAPTEGENALMEQFNQLLSGMGAKPEAEPPPPDPADAPEDDEVARRRHEQEERVRERLRAQVASGVKDSDPIEIEVEESAAPPFMQVLAPQGMEDMGSEMQGMLGSLMPRKRKKKTMTIGEARAHFAAEEARALIDQESVTREAIELAEQSGIIFVDEMDKVAGRGGGAGGGSGPDVSREGVQRDILPIIEGSTVQTKHGPVQTDFVLFIAAGAFHLSKPSDLIPELQGRLPIRVELENLTQADLRRILTEPKNALVKQYRALLATEGITVEFTEDAIDELARLAAEVNVQMENIGARRLHTIMERLLDDVSFNAPDLDDKRVHIDGAYVRDKLTGIVKDEDLSRYIL